MRAQVAFTMELIVSIGLLTGIVMIADVTLAIQGNWPKIIRVTLAAATYIGVLGFLLKSMGRLGAPPAKLPLWVFFVAGAAAGLASGFVRPDVDSMVVIASAILTPTLIGSVHWIALQRWSRLRARIVARPPAGKG
jgi:hypothetical protein